MSFGRSTFGREGWGRAAYGRLPGSVDLVDKINLPDGLRPFVTHYIDTRTQDFLTLETGVAQVVDPISGLIWKQPTPANQPGWDAVNGMQFDGIDDVLQLDSPIVLTPPFTIIHLVRRTDELNTPLGLDASHISIFKAGTTVRHRGNGIDAQTVGSLILNQWKAEAVTSYKGAPTDLVALYQTTQIGTDTAGLPITFSMQKMPAYPIDEIYGEFDHKVTIICAGTFFGKAVIESILADLEAG